MDKFFYRLEDNWKLYPKVLKHLENGVEGFLKEIAQYHYFFDAIQLDLIQE